MRTILVFLLIAGGFAHVRAENKVDCGSVDLSVQQLIRAYAEDASVSDGGEANYDYQRLRYLLYKELGAKDPCFAPGLNALAQSVAEYEPNGQGLWDWVAFLIVNGKLKFLTRELRSELGGRWVDRVPGTREYAAIGGYDCAESTVYLDPYLRPFDLYATLAHEMDHFFRDKLTAPAPDPNFLPSQLFLANTSPPQLNWDLYNVADEVWATLDGGEPQLSLQSEWFLTTGFFSHNKRRFEIRQDLTEFAPHGPVREIAKIFSVGRGAPGWGVAEYILRGTNPSAKNAEALSRLRDLRLQVWNSILKAYFPQRQPSIPKGDLLSFFTFNLMNYAEGQEGQSTLSTLQGVDSGKLSSPSPMCKAYMDSLARGEVTNYVGVHFASGDSSKSPVHPALRPCLNLKSRL